MIPLDYERRYHVFVGIITTLHQPDTVKRVVRAETHCTDFVPSSTITMPNLNDLSLMASSRCHTCGGNVEISFKTGDESIPKVTLPPQCRHHKEEKS